MHEGDLPVINHARPPDKKPRGEPDRTRRSPIDAPVCIFFGMAKRIRAVCGKPVSDTEPHFRSGIKRMPVRCYEERVKPKPPRAGAHPSCCR